MINTDTEWKRLFSGRIQEKLKEKIKAGVYVRITPDDRVYVEITKQECNIAFTDIVGDSISNSILFGTPAETYVDEIVRHYKKFVLGKFFFY